MNVQLAYPYRFGSDGRTATSDEDRHLRDLIEAVLFTSPGERVNRPNFGSGLFRLPFGPNSEALAATAQFLVQGSLQQWLGDRVVVEDVSVISEDSTLTVTVVYARRKDGERRTETFARRSI